MSFNGAIVPLILYLLLTFFVATFNPKDDDDEIYPLYLSVQNVSKNIISVCLLIK